MGDRSRPRATGIGAGCESSEARSPIFGEWFRDPFQNIDQRWTVGAGVGYEVVDTGRISWEVECGPSYQEARFDSVEGDDSKPARTFGLMIATTYEHELAEWLDFTYDWRFNFVNEESGSYTDHMVAGLEFEITRRFDLDFTVIWDRIQDPLADSGGVMPERDDFRLVTALGFEF